MKTLKSFTAFILFLILAISCKSGVMSKSSEQEHNMEASISGLGNDTILVAYFPLARLGEMEEPIQDTIFSVNGRFTYRIPNDEPILLYPFPKKGEYIRQSGRPYRPNEKHIVLLLKPEDRIMVRGELRDLYIDYEVKGDEFNEQYAQVRKGYIGSSSKAVAIELVLDSLMSSNGDKEQINELFQKRNELSRLARAEHLNYIQSNPDKELSAFYLSAQPLDTVGAYYSKLSDNVRGGLFQNALDTQYNKFRKYTRIKDAEHKIVEGEVAPDFVLPSLNGEFSLQNLKSKYIVLDFWGSWCPPCIKGLPKMKEYYTSYKDKVEFVGIDCNETKDKWRKAVQKYELSWTQVMNISDIDKDVAVLYGVQNFPTKFILDKDKRIIAKFMGETDDFYKKLDELLAEK